LPWHFLTPASDIPSQTSLRSSSNCDLVVPRMSRKIGDRAADRLETLAFDCFIQEQTEEFSVSCCLHREHCVNSGMHHRSACRGRITSHCCYCQCLQVVHGTRHDTINFGGQEVKDQDHTRLWRPGESLIFGSLSGIPVCFLFISSR